MRDRVLISWVAVNNDPYERDRTGNCNPQIPGPTLTLLFDGDSPYAGSISDFVLFCGRSPEGNGGRESRAVTETVKVLGEMDASLRIHRIYWDCDDPTDHLKIFEFLRKKLPEMRKRFANQELIIHVSPGTPSMQTVLVLMGETGFVDTPFTLVKSYRKQERNGRPAVAPVQLGIESYYKAYKAARPSETSSVDAGVIWDPAKFRSEQMRKLFDEARRFAQLNVPVLLLGERGTGKTTLAGWIRSNSPYRVPERDAHWPAVACGQYTPETMRAELFGYKRGAYTGAESEYDGLLAKADKDTLFLDEVGDVSRDLQRLLIKAIEERRYMRLGEDVKKTSAFRLISATNLSDEKLRERLDPDFFDRISYLTLRMPPLREIPEEIPWLWENVFTVAMRQACCDRIQLPDAVHRTIVRELADHPLPGNMRDLFRVAYRTIAAASDRYSPLSATDASRYGLTGLNGSYADAEAADFPRSVARAFAESAGLDELIAPGKTFKTKDVERALKGYLADELRRVAKRRGVKPDTLCDVTGRSLSDWSTAKSKNTSSE